MVSPVAPALTPSQTRALRWLKERGGDGCFNRFGVAFAQGETAPVMRSTWNTLRDAGLVEFYGGRLRVTPAGANLDVKAPSRLAHGGSDVRWIVAKSGAE